MKTRIVILITLTIAIGLIAWRFYPVYPSRLSLCELIDERAKEPDRWATPHVGATLFLNGTLFGGPEGGYGFDTTCHGRRVFFAVETTPFTLASPFTRYKLRVLATADWRRRDTAVPVNMVARVSSEVQGCFGPGLIVTALAVRTRGPVKISPRN